MVRDGILSARSFLKIAEKQYALEAEELISAFILELLNFTINGFLPEISDQQRNNHYFYEESLVKIGINPSQYELRKRMFRLLKDPEDIERAKNWVETNNTGIALFDLTNSEI